MVCSIAGYIISAIKKEKANPIPFKERIILSGLFSANILTTNYALLYLSYPVQVIGRNIRFLFVVIVGAFFSRVAHTHTHIKLGKHKIFMAIVITSGVLLFNFAKEVRVGLCSLRRIRRIIIRSSISGLGIRCWPLRLSAMPCSPIVKPTLRAASSQRRISSSPQPTPMHSSSSYSSPSSSTNLSSLLYNSSKIIHQSSQNCSSLLPCKSSAKFPSTTWWETSNNTSSP